MKRFDLNDIFRPKFFEIFRSKSYNKKTFISDVIAGVIVGIIALPLAIAFGIASGVSPQQGLITAIVTGFIISVFGGSHYQIGGPTGAFIVIVYGIIAEFGFQGLLIATIIAGVILVLMGILRLGEVIKFMPYPIIIGFTSGIAVVIFSTQIKDFFGLSIAEVPSEFIDKWIVYFKHFNTINYWALGIGILTIVISILWNKVTKKIPGTLIAIIITTVISFILQKNLGINIDTIGSKYPELAGGVALPKSVAPDINMKTIRLLLQPAFTIAILCAIESLLSAMIADNVTGKKHHSNTELIAQGMANIVIPFFGGIPATGAIARTMANINNGGQTPIAGIVHSIVLLLIYLLLMPLAVHIPLSCLAGILVIVSYNMSGWRTFVQMFNNPRSDVIVLLVTFFLTVIFDLTIAIEVGLLMAIILFLKRVMETSKISVIEEEIHRSEDAEDDTALRTKLDKSIVVYEINGPFFFGLANIFDEVDVTVGKTKTKVRILRMRNVPFIDSTGIKNLRNLYHKSKKENIQIILSGVTDDVYQTLEKAGFVEELGEEFIFDHINKAIPKAESFI